MARERHRHVSQYKPRPDDIGQCADIQLQSDCAVHILPHRYAMAVSCGRDSDIYDDILEYATETRTLL